MSVKTEKTQRRERLQTTKRLLLADDVELTLREVWGYLYNYARMEIALLRVQRSGRQVAKRTRYLNEVVDLVQLRRDLTRL